VRSRDNFYSLVHPITYYTLNNIPQGDKLKLSEASTQNSAESVRGTVKSPTGIGEAGAGKQAPTAQAATSNVQQTPNFEEVKPLLERNTCLACHDPNKKLVGPAYSEVAKRNYTNEEIVELIHNPQPKNWPDYAVAMPPMPQVTREDALKIAAYINSLKE